MCWRRLLLLCSCAPDCAQAQDDTDCIYAFNLTRQIVPREMHILVENAAKDNLRSVYSDFRDEDVSIHHFNGGPCESRRANAVALLQYTKREV